MSSSIRMRTDSDCSSHVRMPKLPIEEDSVANKWFDAYGVEKDIVIKKCKAALSKANEKNTEPHEILDIKMRRSEIGDGFFYCIKFKAITACDPNTAKLYYAMYGKTSGFYPRHNVYPHLYEFKFNNKS